MMDIKDSIKQLFKLPEEVKKFEELQDSLNNNIEHHEKILENMEKKVIWAQRDVDKYYREIANISRRISSIEDDVSTAEHKNNTLKNEIEKVIKDIQDAKRQISNVHFTKDIETRKFKIADEKIENYKCKVEEMESNDKLFVEVKEYRNRIAQLKKAKI
ncbi:keratin, type II cytoskeletal I-like [Centruroides vittatus]|uniref:keratin, type II cytoskeletal I-like n=1 Tax=Centruroides vittatus TaxID=120091 RepID=UPI00350F3DFC